MKENPTLIKIFSRDEFKQHKLRYELDNNEKLRLVIGDIRDYDSLFAAMHDIDYVLH